MRDELYDRNYQDGREALHDGIDRLIASTARTFSLIAAIQFRAPWSGSARSRGGRAGVA
jgi:hypothetical protein